MNLSALDDNDVRGFGRNLLYNEEFESSNFSTVAQLCTQYIYDNFSAPDNTPGFALVRIFYTLMYDDLTAELQAKSRSTGRHLVLVGSTGALAEWCDPALSQNRRIQPLDNQLSPMFQGVFSDLGFPIDVLSKTAVPTGAEGDMSILRMFYVQDASRSSYITDQKTFVRPYGIQSVIALGARFLSGDAYTMIGFTTVPLTPHNAETFGALSAYLTTLLARFDQPGNFW